MLLGINTKQMSAADMLYHLQDYITQIVAIKLQQDGSTNYLLRVRNSITQNITVTVDEETARGTVYVIKDQL